MHASIFGVRQLPIPFLNVQLILSFDVFREVMKRNGDVIPNSSPQYSLPMLETDVPISLPLLDGRMVPHAKHFGHRTETAEFADDAVSLRRGRLVLSHARHRTRHAYGCQTLRRSPCRGVASKQLFIVITTRCISVRYCVRRRGQR